MFKPKVSMESQELLVQQYKHLRQRDTGGSAKSSWRITVRQLESMLRLSESFARLHCSEEVTAKHVKEAYRLLNKSIIRYERFCYLRIIYNLNNNRVDQPDVDLDNDDAPEEDPVEETMETDAEPEPTETTKKPMKLTYEKYKKMSFLLIDYIKNKEETLEATEGGDTDNTPKRSDVVNWYLEELSGEIESQEELVEHRQIVEKVVDRLIYQDQVIVPLTNTTKGGEAEDPFLVVHPNYIQDQ